MTYYYIIFLVTLLIQFIRVDNDKQYLRRVVFTFIPLFLLGALRANWNDYNEYEAIFNEAHRWIGNIGFASEHSEYGYLILNSIIPTWRLFLILTSAFSCLGFGYVFYKSIPPKMGWLAVVLFFLAGDKTVFFMYGGIRNALAIAIFCLSLEIIQERRWILYLILTVLAMQFHTSAVLFMPLAFVVGFSNQMSKKEAWIWITVMLVLQFISLNSVFDDVTDFVSLNLDRYSGYATKIEEIGDTRSILIRFVSAVFVLMFVWFMRTTELSKVENVTCRIALLYSMAHLLGALNFRLSQCYIIFFVAGVSILLFKWKRRIVPILFTLLVLAYLWFAFFRVYMQSDNFDVLRTYQSVFNS